MSSISKSDGKDLQIGGIDRGENLPSSDVKQRSIFLNQHPSVTIPIRPQMESKSMLTNLNLRVATSTRTVIPTASVPGIVAKPRIAGPELSGNIAVVQVPSAGFPASRQVMTSAGEASVVPIIRNAHTCAQPAPTHISQSVFHPTFSSHVPRGTAAVASISVAPKSAVATPMQPLHNMPPLTLNTSSALLLPSQITHKTTAVSISESSIPALQKSGAPPLTVTQVIDLQKPTGQVQIGLAPVRGPDSSIRPIVAPSTAKPVYISQPIVQHLQHIPEKGFYKPAVSTSVLHENKITYSHQHSMLTTSGVTPSTTAIQTSAKVLHPASSHAFQGPVFTQTPRPSQTITLQPSVTPVTTVVAVTSHPTFTVVSSKSNSQSIPLVTSLYPQPGQQLTSATSVPKVTNMPMPVVIQTTLATATSVPLVTSVAGGASSISSTIPVAKVFPQPLSGVRTGMERSVSEAATNLMTTHASRNTVTTAPTIVHSRVPVEKAVPTTYSLSSGPYYYDSCNVPTIRQYTSSGGMGLSAAEQAVTSASTAHHPVMMTVDSPHRSSGLPSHMTSPESSSGPMQPAFSPQGSSISNHSTSPRPSILRKRTNDARNTVVKKNLLTSLPVAEVSSPHVETVTPIASMPKPGNIPEESITAKGNLRVSDSKEVSAFHPVKSDAKSSEMDSKENASTNGTNHVKFQSEASPRKKPRKQQLAANELLDTHSTDGEEEFEKVRVSFKKTIKEDNAKMVTFCKRPNMSLLNAYHHSWKSKHNHFAKYADVKPKEDKKPTVNDLANMKGISQKVNGWKIYHLSTQLEEVTELEESVYSRLSEVLNFVSDGPVALSNKPSNLEEERLLNKISDLIKGNLQRSKIVQDQVSEAQQQVVKVLDHKQHIVEILNKYVSKRTLKKKEKS